MPDLNPTIPPGEYPQRWTRVQKWMTAHGIDLVLAYADDRAVFGPAHARWLADLPTHFEPMCVLFAAKGEPVLLTGPESDEYARLRGRIADVRVLREFTHPDEDYPYSRIESLAQVVAGLSGSVNRKGLRVGLGGRGLMSAEFLRAIHASLPEAEWLDVEAGLCALRAVKSSAEIAVIRRAYAIAHTGFEAALAAIRPGISERAVAAEIEAAIRRDGAEGTGIDTIVASGPNARPILARSTWRRIEENDLVLLTIAPRYEGYHAAIGRPVLVGQPSREAMRALEAAMRAQELCAAALRPGVEGRAVEAIGRNIMEAAGSGLYFLYSGVHSVGVIEFEPPIFGPSSDARIEAGMVISVDIPVFNAPWGGLRVERGYLITETGAEPLQPSASA
jgi:Xaa-Pro aminopeptidase